VTSNRAFGYVASNRAFGHVYPNRAFGHVASNCAIEHVSSNRAFGHVTSNCAFGHVASNRAFGHVTSNRAFGHVTSNRVNGRHVASSGASYSKLLFWVCPQVPQVTHALVCFSSNLSLKLFGLNLLILLEIEHKASLQRGEAGLSEHQKIVARTSVGTNLTKIRNSRHFFLPLLPSRPAISRTMTLKTIMRTPFKMTTTPTPRTRMTMTMM
jgi:hypothetical protein